MNRNGNILKIPVITTVYHKKVMTSKKLQSLAGKSCSGTFFKFLCSLSENPQKYKLGNFHHFYYRKLINN